MVNWRCITGKAVSQKSNPQHVWWCRRCLMKCVPRSPSSQHAVSLLHLKTSQNFEVRLHWAVTHCTFFHSALSSGQDICAITDISGVIFISLSKQVPFCLSLYCTLIMPQRWQVGRGLGAAWGRNVSGRWNDPGLTKCFHVLIPDFPQKMEFECEAGGGLWSQGAEMVGLTYDNSHVFSGIGGVALQEKASYENLKYIVFFCPDWDPMSVYFWGWEGKEHVLVELNTRFLF